MLGDPGVDAAASAGLCCVSVSGVWNWRGTNPVGGKVALPDWHDIALNGRRVVLAFDSDVTAKRAVATALGELAGHLGSKGAKVEYLHLPGLGAGKTSLDDYLKANSVGDLWLLARPEPPAGSHADGGTPREESHTRTPQPDQPEQVCAPDGVCAHTPRSQPPQTRSPPPPKPPPSSA